MNRSFAKPNKSPSFHPKDSLLIWILALIVSVVVSTVAVSAWLNSEIKKTITSPEVVESLLTEIEKSRPQLKAKAVPSGAILLFGEKCPEAYIDISNDYNGRYVWVDNSITTNPKTFDTDGSHEHNAGDGEHSHHVSGSTSNLGKGEHMGTNSDRDAPNHETVLTVSGTAEPAGSGHKHTGGAHEHKRVGIRLCRAPS